MFSGIFNTFWWIFYILVFLFFLWLFFGRNKGNIDVLGNILSNEEYMYKIFGNHSVNDIVNISRKGLGTDKGDRKCNDDDKEDDDQEEDDVSEEEYTESSFDEDEYEDIHPPAPPKESKGEFICRRVLESIYDKKFTNERPSFLRNTETDRLLEIDCYNEELKIGLEYNGIQHYNWPNFTNQTQEEFIKQLRRDEFKKKMCDEHGVYLITVPYYIPHEQIRKYIIDKLPRST